jgi:hypothetical protein
MCLSRDFPWALTLKSVLMQALRHSHVCKFAASEENPELVDMGGPEEGKLPGFVMPSCKSKRF